MKEEGQTVPAFPPHQAGVDGSGRTSWRPVSPVAKDEVSAQEAVRKNVTGVEEERKSKGPAAASVEAPAGTPTGNGRKQGEGNLTAGMGETGKKMQGSEGGSGRRAAR